MLAAIRMTVSLLKLRIGSAVAASALAGMAIANGPALAWWQAAGLTLSVLGASGAAGFVLYCGASSASFTTRIDVGNTTSYTIPGLLAGATAVQLGSVLLRDPSAADRVTRELSDELAARDLKSAADAVGLAHQQPDGSSR